MAAIVTDIRAAILAQQATTLGGTYQRIPYVFNVERMDIRTARLGYGCRALGGVPPDVQMNRTFTIDQGFEMVFTDTFAKDVKDLDKETAIDTMFNKADEVMKAIVNTKLGLSATVLFVGAPTYAEPELVRAAKVVVLRVQFIVKYRTALS